MVFLWVLTFASLRLLSSLSSLVEPFSLTGAVCGGDCPMKLGPLNCGDICGGIC